MVSGNFDIPRSWIICHGPFSINVPPIITATIHNNFYCSEQYRCMVFALPTYRPSFRDIEICFRHMPKNFITWAFEEVFFAISLPTKINLMIEKFLLNFLKNYSALQSVYILTTHYLVSM